MATLHRKAGVFRCEAFRVCPASDRHEDFLRRHADLAAVRRFCHDGHRTIPDRAGRITAALDRLDLGTQMEGDALFFHDRLCLLRQFEIHDRHEAVHHLDDRDLRAEGRIRAGEFHTDHAAADDDHGGGPLIQQQRVGGIDDVIRKAAIFLMQPRDRGWCRRLW